MSLLLDRQGRALRRRERALGALPRFPRSPAKGSPAPTTVLTTAGRLLAAARRVVALLFYPPASVRTHYCACDERHGEKWCVRGGMSFVECTQCGGRIPLGGAR
jgi:hypothetical protein